MATPSVTEEMIDAGFEAAGSRRYWLDEESLSAIYLAMRAAEPPHTGLTDVERVARAIHGTWVELEGGEKHCPNWEHLDETYREDTRKQARAAIAAMQQPTDEADNLISMLVQVAREREAAGRLPDCIPGAQKRLDEARDKLRAALLVSDRSGVESALRAARPIVEADLEAARDQKDADWEGMSAEALRKIDAVLNDTEGPEERFREALAVIKGGHPNPIALARAALDTPTIPEEKPND